MLVKFLLGTILVLACSFPVQALPVYSSTVTDQRSSLCQKIAATAESVADHGLSKEAFQNITNHPAVKAMPVNDQRTLWDAVYRAHTTRTSWWAYAFCMDRLET